MEISHPSETLLASPPYTGCFRQRNRTRVVEEPRFARYPTLRLAFGKTKGSKNGGQQNQTHRIERGGIY